MTGLNPEDLGADPSRVFQRWLTDAEEAGAALPEATVLATATPDGRPSARAVLVRGVDERGVIFYTNYESRKGHELAANPHAALCSVWHVLQRQVRIEGTVRRLPGPESDAYWAQRPPLSRLSAAASPQSEVIASREELEDAVAALADRYPDGEVPRPARWGGLLLVPDTFEFWQGRDGRLHDRLRYRVNGGRWTVERLAP